MRKFFSNTATCKKILKAPAVESGAEGAEGDLPRTAQNGHGDWIKLLSFGKYEHPKGLQLVNYDSARAMVDYFNSLRGKFMRRFIGLPIYIGHPDDPDYAGGGDRSIYGRVEGLKIEGETLWVLPRWTELGKKLFSNGFLRYLSPRWLMRKVEGKIFQPVRLISIGLTNHPNLCQEKIPTATEIRRAQFIGNKSEVLAKNENQSEDSSPSAQGNLEQSEVRGEVGQTSPENGGNLHVSSLSGNLLERTNGQPRGERILALVHEQMSIFGDDYQSAWNAIKRRCPALFRENF
ncbi:MAG: phage protease [Puniceicoccales bacterium]|jgi:hypothetical protein|nr:phage protease [Puniceicoccales bacterium]